MSAFLPSQKAQANRVRPWFQRAPERAHERAEGTRAKAREAEKWRSLSILGGGGLLVCGALRGSWSGLALAAVGSYLVYRGFSGTHSNECSPDNEAPPVARTSPGTDRVRLREEPPVPATNSPQAPATPPDTEASAVGSVVVIEYRELLPEELPLAHTAAYYLALERGGGSLPHFDHARAADDFLRAAGQIIRLRSRG